MAYKHLVFPENSRFLVTGGAGFIGSNLCEALLKMGFKVRCLDDLSTGKRHNVDIFREYLNYEFFRGDVKDLDTCLNACEGMDYVLHEAAWGSVPRSIEMPLFYSLNNIQGTLNMLEAARRSGVKTFVNRAWPASRAWTASLKRRVPSRTISPTASPTMI